MCIFKQLHFLCIHNNISLASAESCTAGLLASKIVSVSGASVFLKEE